MSPQRSVLCGLSIVIVVSAGCTSLDQRRASIDQRREARAPVLAERTRPIASPVRQHIGTVASVDEHAQTIQLTHGPVVRVSPSTRVRYGKTDQPIALRDLRRGDKVIFSVAAADTSASAAGSERARRGVSPDAEASGSALPRDVAGLATPGPVVEVLVFRPR